MPALGALLENQAGANSAYYGHHHQYNSNNNNSSTMASNRFVSGNQGSTLIASKPVFGGNNHANSGPVQYRNGNTAVANAGYGHHSANVFNNNVPNNRNSAPQYSFYQPGLKANNNEVMLDATMYHDEGNYLQHQRPMSTTNGMYMNSKHNSNTMNNNYVANKTLPPSPSAPINSRTLKNNSSSRNGSKSNGPSIYYLSAGGGNSSDSNVRHSKQSAHYYQNSGDRTASNHHSRSYPTNLSGQRSSGTKMGNQNSSIRQSTQNGAISNSGYVNSSNAAAFNNQSGNPTGTVQLNQNRHSANFPVSSNNSNQQSMTAQRYATYDARQIQAAATKLGVTASPTKTVTNIDTEHRSSGKLSKPSTSNGPANTTVNGRTVYQLKASAKQQKGAPINGKVNVNGNNPNKKPIDKRERAVQQHSSSSASSGASGYFSALMSHARRRSTQSNQQQLDVNASTKPGPVANVKAAPSKSHQAAVTHPEPTLIWSVDHAKPTVLVRKPRTRRLLQTLLCCFGAEPKRSDAVDSAAYVASQNTSPLPIIQPNGTRANDKGTFHMPYSPKQSEKLLLPPMRQSDANKICLIIDLDETLVHSSFKPVKNPDFVIPVEIDGVVNQVYVLKRPHVDEFLRKIGEQFECILFTASLAKYADPVADLLDKWNVFRARLFREACVFHKGNYVKDLARLGRDLKRVVIIDNSPASYAFHPDNAVPVQSWFDDMHDRELLDILPVMNNLSHVDNVYSLLRQPTLTMDNHSVHLMNNNNNNSSQSRLPNTTSVTATITNTPASNSPISSVQRPNR